MQSSTNIGHTRYFKNINEYLSARKRQMPNLKGVCNGASLLLMVHVYEAMNEYYKHHTDNKILSFYMKIRKGVNDFSK